MTDAAWPANPFWDFSVGLYRRPGVAEACLALQERRGVDVNILLYCVWLGAERGVALSEADIAKIRSRISAWHDRVVRPLRGVRTALKGNLPGAPRPLSEPLRARIKSAELDAERIEQQVLYEEQWSDASSANRSIRVARVNVSAYLKSLGILQDSDDGSAIDAILSAGDMPI